MSRVRPGWGDVWSDTRAVGRAVSGGASKTAKGIYNHSKHPLAPYGKPKPAKPAPYNKAQAAKNAAQVDGGDGKPKSTATAKPSTTVSAVNAAATAKRIGGTRRYNAPLHPDSRPVLTNAGSHGAGPRPYLTGEIFALYAQSNLSSLTNEETGASWYSRKANWAFRFLYNPASITVSTQIDDQATPTALDAGTYFGQQQAIGFQLYLNRQVELARGLVPGRGSPDEAAILASGTQYDVNHLYKVINGDAGDMGFLVNTLVRVVFGPSIFYEGFITNIDVQHTQFNAKMTPMQSTVDLNVTRVTANQNPAGVAGGDTTT